MKRVLIEIAYDGTNYFGWQTQPGFPTIEDILNKKLSKLLKEEIVVIGASRTDSGVHAKGNVAVFDTVNSIPADKVACALNSIMPDAIMIQQSYEVPLDFHPRKCKAIKTYEYRIYNSEHLLPTERLYSYYVKESLDVEKMIEASRYLLGEHDFKGFSNSGSNQLTTIRNIHEIDIKKIDTSIVITISGNGFLYNMVRIIVGTLVRVGRNTYSPEYMNVILEKKDRTYAGHKAPACGLSLLGIKFQGLDF